MILIPPSNQSKTSMKDRKDYSHRTGLIGRIVLTLYIQEEFPQGKRETGKAQAGIQRSTGGTEPRANLEQNSHGDLRMYPWDPQQIC